jgi:putative ABC transport system ATP-binding protein
MIVAKDIKKYYENGLIKALNGISFEIQSGEIVAIMGPSGCGKSTLLNIIGALDLPTEGEITIDGKNLLQYKPFHTFRSSMIGFIFQFHHLIPSLTLLENVEIPLYTQKLNKAERRKRASEMLIALGLKDRMNFLPTRVSGGERQCAAIARALINNPRIVLADELTGNLDTITGDYVMKLVLNLCREKHITFILATHNHEIAIQADRIIKMKNGLIEPSGSGLES